MSKILSPFTVSILGLLWGVFSGLCWFYARADSLVEVALARKPPAEASVAKARQWDFWSVEIDNLASELKDEKARLQKEEESLGLKSARMAADRQELEKLRTDLNAMHTEITDKVIEIQADEAKNLRMLAQTYSSLTPHAAVTIIHDLDDATAVKILSLMKPEIIAPIFEDMAQSDPSSTDAHRAGILSQKLRLMKAQKVSSSQ
jgi:flagellar motility protein MotE (MotC chaperone)